MQPTAFNQENQIFGPPPGVSHSEVQAISGFKGPIITEQGPKSGIVTCWKPTKEELEEINKTGRVWLITYGEQMFPTYLSGISPWKEQNDQNG